MTHDLACRSRLRYVWHGLAFTAAAAIVATPGAQEPLPIVPSHEWTAARAAAVIEALRSGLAYVPGEVIVKFRKDAAPMTWQASLMAAAAPAANDGTQRLGDVVVARFPADPDAERLAQLLASQPNVEYAHPNYIRFVLNDPPGPSDDQTPAQEQPDVPNTAPAADEAPDPCDAAPTLPEDDDPPAQKCERQEPAATRADEPSADANPARSRTQETMVVAGEAANTPAPARSSARRRSIVSAAPAPVVRGSESSASAPREDPARALPRARRRTGTMGAQAPLASPRPGEIVEAAPVPFTPNDFNAAAQWNLGLLEMPLAWGVNPGGSPDIVVAVVDSGLTTVNESIPLPLNWNGTSVDLAGITVGASPDLQGARIVAPWDFTFMSFVLGSPGRLTDMSGHGTHVAGTIGADTHNGTGLAGIAYRTGIMPLKACVGYWEVQMLWALAEMPGIQDILPFGVSACFDDAVVEAIRYAADNGAQVVNISLGGPAESPAVLEAIQYAVARGAFVAMAAGNTFENGNLPSYPAAYAPLVQGAVAVGAVDRQKQRSYYSTTNAYVTLVAPGGDLRTAPPQAVFQSTLDRLFFDPATTQVPRFDRYAILGFQGTSMAAAHVSGLAALLMHQGVTRPAAVEAALTRFAQDLGPQGPDAEYGYGLIRPRETLRGLGLLR